MAVIDSFQRLVEDSIDGADEIGVIEQVLSRVGAPLRSDKVILFSPEPGESTGLEPLKVGLPANFFGHYASELAPHDPWRDGFTRKGLNLQRGAGMLSQQLMPMQAFRRTWYCAELMREYDYDAMAATVLEEALPGRGAYVMAVSRRGLYDAADLQWLKAATPWVRCLMRARRRTLRERAVAAGIAAGTEALPLGMLVLTDAASMVQANELARRWLGMSSPAGRAAFTPGHWGALPHRLAPGRSNERLQAMALQALGGEPVCQRLVAQDGQALIALATALGGPDQRWPVQVLMVPQRTRVESHAQAICGRLYGMTAAEVALLPLLLDGMTPHEMAIDLHLKLSTVRTHLSNLFHKTGTRRQAELTQRLLRVVSLLR